MVYLQTTALLIFIISFLFFREGSIGVKYQWGFKRNCSAVMERSRVIFVFFSFITISQGYKSSCTEDGGNIREHSEKWEKRFELSPPKPIEEKSDMMLIWSQNGRFMDWRAPDGDWFKIELAPAKCQQHPRRGDPLSVQGQTCRWRGLTRGSQWLPGWQRGGGHHCKQEDRWRRCRPRHLWWGDLWNQIGGHQDRKLHLRRRWYHYHLGALWKWTVGQWNGNIGSPQISEEMIWILWCIFVYTYILCIFVYYTHNQN